MDESLLEWLKLNRSQSFDSPRGTIFKTKTQRFKIIRVNEETQFIEIEFSKRFTVLRLEFWRFKTTLGILRKNRGRWTRLGTRFYADDPDTIEWQIQKKAKEIHPDRHVDLKSAPHVCDILVLTGIAEYGRVINPKTGRGNQAVRLVES
ncbi:MAG: hypothetical protein OEY88_06075 [Candidatus Bathyarchaeota archaeon]|nr:hypothetical protein [Candidatus Bathyarchaeota archaeon]